jgi:hypothetical protein
MKTNRVVKGQQNRLLVAASALSLALWSAPAGADLIECPIPGLEAVDQAGDCNGLQIT